MSRKQNNTAEFFPHRVNHGKTIFKLESKYGNDGYAFLFKMCEMLGATENHYLDLSDSGDWDFFVMKMRLDEDKCQAILNDLIAWGKLDALLFAQRKIIWYDKFVQGLLPLYTNRRRELPTREYFYSRNDNANGESTEESTQSIVEHSKEEERTKAKNEILREFEIWWDLYAKKIDRKRCEKAWNNITKEQRQKAIEHTPLYVGSTPNPKFRKNPLTYLHGEGWENEIVKEEVKEDEDKFPTGAIKTGEYAGMVF